MRHGLRAHTPPQPNRAYGHCVNPQLCKTYLKRYSTLKGNSLQTILHFLPSRTVRTGLHNIPALLCAVLLSHGADSNSTQVSQADLHASCKRRGVLQMAE
jgi:hypothetical protein